jgi:hypothetical protein
MARHIAAFSKRKKTAMKKQTPESFEDLARDLALCVADCIEHPDCPDDLRDALSDPVSNELMDILAPKNSLLLRAVASLAKSEDGRTRAEGETPVVANPERKAAAYTH